jgi:hypothetical protein
MHLQALFINFWGKFNTTPQDLGYIFLSKQRYWGNLRAVVFLMNYEGKTAFHS